jgi:hypothetical protein
MPDQSFEEQALQRILGQMDPMIDAFAQRLGMPPGSKRYTTAEQVSQWTYTPYPDPQERMNKALELHLAGKTPEEIDDELYPNKRRVIEAGRTRPDERISYAREMRRQVGWPDAPDMTLDLLGLGQGGAPPMPSTPPVEEPMPVSAPFDTGPLQ